MARRPERPTTPARAAGRELRDPVSFTFDGHPVTAERGEPVAAALVAAGKLALARSPKYHRPRGPACFRGACDGCLARVDGVPNVTTCLHPVREGAVVESQNTLGSREIDLLRVTDWFFASGLNHHELFAGVPGLQQVMQVFARRVAGLGRLPRTATPAAKASRRALDVLVVGAGPSGMAAALELAAAGRRVEVVDDALAAGGSTVATLDAAWDGLRERFDAAVARGAVTLRLRTTAAGIYGDDVLVVGPAEDADEARAEVTSARDVVLAPGAHDGVVAFEGNDVPGVMSARAACGLLARGVGLGERVAVFVVEGGGPFGEAYARSAASRCDVRVVRGAPVAVSGGTHVKEVAFVEGGKEERLRVDAVLVDAPRAPSFELAEQAGAKPEHEPRGFAVRPEGGEVRDGFWVLGEITGAPLEPARVLADARDLASRVGR